MSALVTIHRDPDRLLDACRTAFEARGKITSIKATGFDGLCPCHDDTNPSLHVEKGHNGIVMTCRACGATVEQILEALSIRDPYGDGDMTVSSLFYESTGKASAETPKAPAVAPREKVEPITTRQPQEPATPPVTEDDRKRLLANRVVVDRLDRERGIDEDTLRDFGAGLTRDGRLMIPTHNRSGELSPRLWRFPEQRDDEHHKMHGTRGSSPDLFPRPETTMYPDGADVILVEGELDALCAITHGIPAIGCPGTNMWKDEDAVRFVRFGSVTIITDADESGRKWATEVEADLRTVGVPVRVRDFGDRVAKGYDLTDHALKCRDENVALSMAIERLPISVAGSITSDLFGEPEPAVEANVGGTLFYEGSTHVLFGQGGAGKTYLFLVAALVEIRNGGCVLFFDYETGARTIKRRLDALGFTDDEKLRFHHFDVMRGRARPLEGDVAMLHGYLDTFEPTLIGIDSWSSVHGAGNFGDVKDDGPVERVLAQIFRPLTRDGAAVVILDHVPKGENATKGKPFGSQRKFTGAHVVIEVKGGTKGRAKLISWKDNVGDRPIGSDAVLWQYVYSASIAAIVPTDPTDTQGRSMRNDVRPTGIMERVSVALEDAGNVGMTATELKDTVSGKAAVVLTARSVLVTEDYVTETKSSTDGQPFATARYVSSKAYREADDISASVGTQAS